NVAMPTHWCCRADNLDSLPHVGVAVKSWRGRCGAPARANKNHQQPGRVCVVMVLTGDNQLV
ncbi:MAG TPA: hypothetical protein VD886_10385, partial [Herpetosiphonaceae bacterium]|nr:hypothetical protein [Herpetosiphonaceae bacterium]